MSDLEKRIHIFAGVTTTLVCLILLTASLCDSTYQSHLNLYPTIKQEALWEVEIETEEVEEVAVEEPIVEEDTYDEPETYISETDYGNYPVGSLTTENPEWWAVPDENGYYQPSDIQTYGVIYWNGWRWTSYSQRVMPGDGLDIPGRHVDEYGFVCDGDGYICLGTSELDIPRGTVIMTLFGRLGKIYDYGYAPSMDIDIYTDW